MTQDKPSFYKHLIVILLMTIISFIDHIYMSLFPFYYHPIASLLFIIAAIVVFVILARSWFYKPYVSMLNKIDTHYKAMTDVIAIAKDNNNEILIKEQAKDLEDLIYLYKTAQEQQFELVCQLTNTNKVLDQNSKFANAIVQITSEILRSGDIHSILQLILDKAIEIIPNAQKGSILLYNKDFLEYKAMYGYDIEALSDFKFSFHEIFQYNAKDLYEPIIIPDVESFNKNLQKDKFDVLKDTRSFELKSCISCAISIDNQFYGTINIDNVENNYAFVDDHKPIIKYFAEQIGIALKNAQLLEKILYMSQYDCLTCICNRAYFEEQLNTLHKNCEQRKGSYTLVVMDMNDLKLVNDRFGHEAGDKLIVSLTDYISNMEQKPDIFGRTGGDEFALVYKDKTKEEVHRILQIIRNHFIKVPFQYNNESILSATFGYGVSSYPQEAEDVLTLFKNADMLMYMDKKHSKEKN